MQQFNYHPQHNTIDALFEPMRRIFWATSLGWIVLACKNGQGGIINKFLSLSLWKPISNLSYSLYLLHLPLQFIMLASLKLPEHFSNLTAIHKFWGDFAISFLISWFWSLAFEYPFLNLCNIFLKN